MSNIVNFNNFKKDDYENKIKNVRFGLQKFKLVTDTGLLREFYFIALKHKETGITLSITPFSKYLRFTIKNLDTRKPETVRSKGIFACALLNYVFIEKYDEFKITDIRDITIEHGNRFIHDYAYGLTGKCDNKLKSKTTVKRTIKEVASFYVFIQRTYKKSAKNIYGIKMLKKTEIYNKHEDKMKECYITPFTINMTEFKNNDIFRDIPNKVMNILLKLSELYYPEITLAIALQAYAGLRPGEVCNVRQATSPLGGISITRRGDKFITFTIDLSHKYSMRSDLVDVGNIKKRRKQRVYTPFLPVIKMIYEKHLDYLDNVNFEERYSPMFVNSNGMAMTYISYKEKFERLISDYVIPELVNHDDSELRHYGELLLENRLSPHALRHWFTVQLVLDGLSTEMIAIWRGDNNLDSASQYYKNKSELMNIYHEANNEFFNDIISYGGDIDVN